MSFVVGVIPARWGSTRFPGKPLHLIAGKELVLHVWEQCQKCEKLSEVVIATDDQRIFDRCSEYGAKVVMTSDQHPTGTDRLAEVAGHYTQATHFINIQGDEPLVNPALIDQLAEDLIADSSLEMTSAATPLTDPKLINDPNVVKVVINKLRNALYFSRSTIPFIRNESSVHLFYRHIGIYGFRADFLLNFVKLEESQLEKVESLEQLRALDNGAKIRMVITEEEAMGVDTPEQAAEIEQLILAQKV